MTFDIFYSQKIEVDDPLKLCAPKCVDGPPQSATGVEQGEADTEVQVDHNSGRKMKVWPLIQF